MKFFKRKKLGIPVIYQFYVENKTPYPSDPKKRHLNLSLPIIEALMEWFDQNEIMIIYCYKNHAKKYLDGLDIFLLKPKYMLGTFDFKERTYEIGFLPNTIDEELQAWFNLFSKEIKSVLLQNDIKVIRIDVAPTPSPLLEKLIGVCLTKRETPISLWHMERKGHYKFDTTDLKKWVSNHK